MTTGVLFIGHGTRRVHGTLEFKRFVEAVQTRISDRVALSAYAFLELQEPNIVTGIDDLVAQGATAVFCVPLLLFSAGHMNVDIPAELARARDRHPNITMTLSSSFGEHPAFQEVTLERMGTAIEWPVDECGVLLLGRGNQEPSAQAVFYRIAADLEAQFASRKVVVGFLAGTGATMEEGLDKLTRFGYTSLIVSPFLWFSGWLTDTLPQRVAQWRVNHPEMEVRIAEHIGVHEAIVQVVAQRVVSYMDSVV